MPTASSNAMTPAAARSVLSALISQRRTQPPPHQVEVVDTHGEHHVGCSACSGHRTAYRNERWMPAAVVDELLDPPCLAVAAVVQDRPR